MADVNTSEIRQADNKVIIEGVVNEVRLEIKTLKTETGDKECITGEIDIKTDSSSIHPIRVFSYKYKTDVKTGTVSENGIFKGLNTIKEEYKSIVTDGEENADRVRITAGQLGINEYYGNDGQLRSFAQLSSNFINRLNSNEELEPKAEFEIEVYIQAFVDEVDKQGNETDRLKVKGLVGVYGGKVIPMEFIVADDGAKNYIRENYNIADTVKIYGDIINSVILTEIEKPVEFGKPRKEIQRTTVRELIITGGGAPYDDENPKKYSVDAMKNAVAERNIYLEKLKKKSQNDTSSSSTSNAGTKTGGTSGGFSTKGKPSASKNKPVEEDEDLPF